MSEEIHSQNMRCIIVDDDEMSIALIRQYVEQTEGLELVTTFSNSVRAANFLLKEPVDLLFLDVEMPNMSGLDLIRTLEIKPQIILITSKKNYAIEAFEEEVTDFLLKPVGYPRFLKAVKKAADIFSIKHNSSTIRNNHLFVKEDSLYVNIPLHDIMYIEALGDYVSIHLTDKKHTVLTTMKAIENRLPPDRFSRVHRSFIVPVDRISNLDGNMLIVEKKLIPIGKSYRKSLMDKLNIV